MWSACPPSTSTSRFARKVRRKATAIQDIREIVEQKLADMLKRNPMRMDYYKRYQEIIADYNREKDRVSIEDTFTRLVDLAASLDEMQRRVMEEGLTEEEYALFSMLLRDDLGKADRERLKVASRSLLREIQALLVPLEQWTQKKQPVSVDKLERDKIRYNQWVQSPPKGV